MMWSPNGLDWEVRTSLPIEEVDMGVIAYLMSNGSRLFAALANGGGQPGAVKPVDITRWHFVDPNGDPVSR